MSSTDPPVGPPLVVFDDGRGTFGPLTDLRPAFMLRAGLGTLLERVEAWTGRRASEVVVRATHQALLAELGLPTATLPADAGCLAINGRLLGLATSIRDLLGGSGRVLGPAGELVAFHGLRRDLDRALLEASPSGGPIDARLATTPWDLTSAIGETLARDLAIFDGCRTGGPSLDGAVRRHLRPDEGQSFGDHPILIDRTATIGPVAVLDASKGPVVIGRGVVVRPLSVLVGPCAVLEGSSVAERALLKASTVIGPHCRAGGEIGGTIFQGFSNKSHDGHLGDSFVGEWVNVGAGTDNSNLLNTYGEVIVRLEPDGGLMRTGRQFWGSILGDHVKLAIGTRLMTGTTVGTGAMVASSRPPAALVPRFAWITDAEGGPKSFRIDRFLETARAMTSRRGRAIGPALEAALRALHQRAVGGG